MNLTKLEQEILNHRLECPDCIEESINDGIEDIFQTYHVDDIQAVCNALMKGDLEAAKDINRSLWIVVLENAVICNTFYGQAEDASEEYCCVNKDGSISYSREVSKQKLGAIKKAIRSLEKKISKIINREVRFPRD